jgi:hypothetical protein
LITPRVTPTKKPDDCTIPWWQFFNIDSPRSPGKFCITFSNHGRLEIRRYSLSRDIARLSQKPGWAGISVGACGVDPHHRRKTGTELRYYLTSLTDRPRFAETVRCHWTIENSQHRVLDVQFGEDDHRTRKDYSPGNLALIRRMALNVIRHNGPSKHIFSLRKMWASLNDDYGFEPVFGEGTNLARSP